MIRIAITEAAFEAIARTLPLGSVGYENATNERGEKLIWLELLLARQLVRLTVLSAPAQTFQRLAAPCQTLFFF
jgi:hypothetical protein